jgi:hypothetical protein
MHAAVENEPVTIQLEIIAVCPDFGATRQIGEFHLADPVSHLGDRFL